MPLTKTSFLKGHIVTQEMREKISKASIGNKKGIGHKVTEETKEILRKIHLGKIMPLEVREKISKKLKGVPLSKERAEKNCLFIKTHFVGIGNHSWKGGISKINKTERQLAMETVEYKNWRKAVFERDNFTCQNCGYIGDKLNADHIKSWIEYPELRYVLNNGQTLCVFCHRKTDTYGNRNKFYGMAEQAGIKIQPQQPTQQTTQQPNNLQKVG